MNNHATEAAATAREIEIQFAEVSISREARHLSIELHESKRKKLSDSLMHFNAAWWLEISVRRVARPALGGGRPLLALRK